MRDKTPPFFLAQRTSCSMGSTVSHWGLQDLGYRSLCWAEGARVVAAPILVGSLFADLARQVLPGKVARSGPVTYVANTFFSRGRGNGKIRTVIAPTFIRRCRDGVSAYRAESTVSAAVDVLVCPWPARVTVEATVRVACHARAVPGGTVVEYGKDCAGEDALWCAAGVACDEGQWPG